MNNFNKSGTGINIECDIAYDTFQAQMNFDENIDRVKINGEEYYIYSDYGNIDTDIDIDDLITYDLNTVTHDKVEEYYENKIHAIFDDYPFDYEDTLNTIDNDLSYMDIHETINTLDLLGIKYTKHYETIAVTGYGQGDFATVLIIGNALEYNLKALEAELTNYFFDTPIVARITINDEELYIEDYDGYYIDEYDKDKVIAWVMDNVTVKVDMSVLLLELDKVVPETLEY